MAENSKMRYAARSANRLGIAVDEFVRLRSAGNKWCCRCREWHPESAFGVDRGNTDGLLPFCRGSTHRVGRRPNTSSRFRGKQHSAATRAKMRAAKLGAANNNWRGGVTPAARRARQHAQYQAWRRAVIARDRGACRRCGDKPRVVHAHHIKPFKTHPELALVVSNGLTLCEPCHQAVHREGVGQWV